MEIVVHESPKMAFERRLVALEAIAQLCRIPGTFHSFNVKKKSLKKLKLCCSTGLVTELYLNYDCDCHASDLSYWLNSCPRTSIRRRASSQLICCRWKLSWWLSIPSTIRSAYVRHEIKFQGGFSGCRLFVFVGGSAGVKQQQCDLCRWLPKHRQLTTC